MSLLAPHQPATHARGTNTCQITQHPKFLHCVTTQHNVQFPGVHVWATPILHRKQCKCAFSYIIKCKFPLETQWPMSCGQERSMFFFFTQRDQTRRNYVWNHPPSESLLPSKACSFSNLHDPACLAILLKPVGHDKWREPTISLLQSHYFLSDLN